ncbi:hypothetical protein [Sphingomonas sp. 22R3R2A-7]|uniref:hypothetical protein n=1 Tax=Sphingomonas sp. 22R3R2A-7 TaxID=3050230 RepID=UPI002FE0BEF0
MVELAYSAPELRLCVDDIVDRNTTIDRADQLYLVLDYAARRAWVELGTSQFYAPEAEDGAGNVWEIQADSLDFSVSIFFSGVGHVVIKELSRPGSSLNAIDRYCASFYARQS